MERQTIIRVTTSNLHDQPPFPQSAVPSLPPLPPPATAQSPSSPSHPSANDDFAHHANDRHGDGGPSRGDPTNRTGRRRVRARVQMIMVCGGCGAQLDAREVAEAARAARSNGPSREEATDRDDLDGLDVEELERRAAFHEAELARVRGRIDVARRKERIGAERARIDELDECPAEGCTNLVRGGGLCARHVKRTRRDRARGKRRGEERAGDGPVCKKMTIPCGRKRWDPTLQDFPENKVNDNGRKNLYQKYRCKGREGDGEKCNKQVRTYCACDPCRILCDECLTEHFLARREEEE